MADDQEPVDKQLYEFCNQHSLLSASSFVAVGSATELLPKFRTTTDTNRLVSEFDLDLMFIHQSLIALPPDQPPNGDWRPMFKHHEVVGVEVSNVHPGFARLFRTVTNSNNREYISRDHMTGITCFGRLNIPVASLCETPAFTLFEGMALKLPGIIVPTSQMQLTFNSSASPLAALIIKAVDVVPCIRCPVWPNEAAEWATRTRRHGWPSKSLIDQCVRTGCAFVSKHHKTSLKPQYEFRFSFSMVEVLLIHSWLPSQKSVYNTLKLMKDEVKRRSPIDRTFLCSYHLKTLMLWACEMKPATFWAESNLVSAAKYLAKVLRKLIGSGQLRHYFIRSNNLLDFLLIDQETQYDDLGHIDDLIRQPSDLFANAGRHLSGSFVTYFPRNMLMLLQVFSEDGDVSSRAATLELVDLYQALNAQIKLETSDSSSEARTACEISRKYFDKATQIDRTLVKCSMPFNESMWSAIQTICMCDGSAERLFPQTARTNHYLNGDISSITAIIELYDIYSRAAAKELHNNAIYPRKSPAEIELGLLSLLQHLLANEYTEYFGLCSGLFMDSYSWFRSMAYFANFCYRTRRDYIAAIDVCNRALTFWEELECIRQESVFSELLYTVTLSNRLSPVFDESLQCVIGCMTLIEYCNNGRRRVSDNVFGSICALEFIYYVKLRCLRQLGADYEIMEAIQLMAAHIHNVTHVELYAGGLDKALQLFSCGVKMNMWALSDIA